MMGFQEYSKPPITVLAEQIGEDDEPRSVITPNGAATANPGDWEVRFPDGNVKVMTDEEFQEDYGSGASESSGNEGKSPAVSEGGDEEDDDGMDESAVKTADNGTPDESEIIEDRSGIGEEAEGETRKSSPPPVRRR